MKYPSRSIAIARISCTNPRVFIAFVGTHRRTLVTSDPLLLLPSGVALGRAAAPDQFGVHHQSVAVLDRHVAAIGRLRLVTSTSSRKPCFRIGRGVSVVASRTLQGLMIFA